MAIRNFLVFIVICFLLGTGLWYCPAQGFYCGWSSPEQSYICDSESFTEFLDTESGRGRGLRNRQPHTVPGNTQASEPAERPPDNGHFQKRPQLPPGNLSSPKEKVDSYKAERQTRHESISNSEIKRNEDLITTVSYENIRESADLKTDRNSESALFGILKKPVENFTTQSCSINERIVQLLMLVTIAVTVIPLLAGFGQWWVASKSNQARKFVTDLARENDQRLESKFDDLKNSMKDRMDAVQDDVYSDLEKTKELQASVSRMVQEQVNRQCKDFVYAEMESAVKTASKQFKRQINALMDDDYSAPIECRNLALERVRKGMWDIVGSKMRVALAESNYEQVNKLWDWLYRADVALRQMASPIDQQVYDGLGTMDTLFKKEIVPGDELWDFITVLYEQGRLRDTNFDYALRIGRDMGKSLRDSSEEQERKEDTDGEKSPSQ